MTLNRTTGDHRNVTFYTASAALLPSVDDVAIFANLTAPASCVLPTPALANPAQEPAEGDVIKVQTDASATANPVTVTAPGSSINAAASLVLRGNQLATFTWSNAIGGYLAAVSSATGAAGHGNILWKPAGGGDATTWAEVMAFVDATECPFDVIVEDGGTGLLTIPVPASGLPYQMHGVSLTAKLGNPNLNIVTIDDGAQLNDFGTIDGALVLKGAPTGAPCFVYTSPSPAPFIVYASRGALFANAGTRPLVDVVNVGGNLTVIFAITDDGGYTAMAGPAGLFGLAPGSVLFLAAFDDLSNLDPSFMVGDPTTTLFLAQRPGATWSTIPSTGGIGFGSMAPNFFGSIDHVALTVAGGSGPTAFRPSAFVAPPDGCAYFDTSLGVQGLPIWWSAAAGFWVDATGAGPQ